MNTITRPAVEEMSAAEDGFDVLALCEIWRALDFPDGDTTPVDEQPSQKEAP